MLNFRFVCSSMYNKPSSSKSLSKNNSYHRNLLRQFCSQPVTLFHALRKTFCLRKAWKTFNVNSIFSIIGARGCDAHFGMSELASVAEVLIFFSFSLIVRIVDSCISILLPTDETSFPSLSLFKILKEINFLLDIVTTKNYYALIFPYFPLYNEGK